MVELFLAWTNNASGGAIVPNMNCGDSKASAPKIAPRILVCGWSGADNIGDELLTKAVVQMLRANGAVPLVVSRDPKITAALHDVETLAWGPRGWPRILLNRTRFGVGVDGVCVGPGGIIQDSSSVWSLPGHFVAPLLLRKLGRPLVGVGLGADTLKRKASRWLLRAVLHDTELVARDPRSVAALADANLIATDAADLVFGLETAPKARSSEILVALGPVATPRRFLPTRGTLRVRVPTRLPELLNSLAGRLDASIAFATFRGPRDRRFAELLAANITRDWAILPHDINEQVGRIASARLLLTNRYHPLVIAARCGTPTIVCSPETKLLSLVEQLPSSPIIKLNDWSKLLDCEVPEPGFGLSLNSLEAHQEALRHLVANCASGKNGASS